MHEILLPTDVHHRVEQLTIPTGSPAIRPLQYRVAIRSDHYRARAIRYMNDPVYKVSIHPLIITIVFLVLLFIVCQLVSALQSISLLRDSNKFYLSVHPSVRPSVRVSIYLR